MAIDVKKELVAKPALSIPENSSEAQKSKKDAIKTVNSEQRASAWELARWPTRKYPMYTRTKIHLPRSYLSSHGEEVRNVHPGQDLNQLVHQHYLENVEVGSTQSVNYVDAVEVVSKRHEFLGPDPRVAGYIINFNGDIYIKWWDSYLQNQWMGSSKWETEVQWNGEKWVEKDI